MNSADLETILFEELDYVASSSLKSENLWPNGRPIPFITAAYFIQDVPVAYFSQLNDADPDDLWKLYRKVWSQSEAPLLYVILPQEIRIYNSYTEPAENANDLSNGDRLLQRLRNLVNIETARQEIRTRLSNYKRLYLDTGAFWSTPDGQRIKREKRADQRLLHAMDQIRRYLLNANLSPELAYALIGRSIFIRYLEDRGVLTDEWVAQITNGQVSDYRSALDDIQTTYRFFEGLSKRFKGDLFPIDEQGKERQYVKQPHLNYLSSFLKGNDLDTGQHSFWPYDFTHIPIELISGIYDTFLSKKTRQDLGAYYTPLQLVDFIVEETLPVEKITPDFTILDPACGSGVFLVRAYQRLVESWQRQYNHLPSSQELSSILKQSIFGIDVQLNAVGIAAFSLYLAMLDFLKTEDIVKEDFRFPGLKDTNLINIDFFSPGVDEQFSMKKFNRIIGNPPWGRGTLKGDALRWVEERGYPTGEKQIVQAFLWRAPEFCVEDGEIALLAPTKSTILVVVKTHEEFRRRFFETYYVRAVVNFSALVYELFESSLSPVIALFYQPEQPVHQHKLVYGVPKPSPLSQCLGAIVLDATDVKYLEREELAANPVLWKVASWGTPRDAALIQELDALPSLQDLEKTKYLRGEEILEGFTIGNTKDEARWLQGMPYLDVNKFKPYVVETHGTVQESFFERPRTQAIYQAPLALIRQSTCEAAFLAVGQVAYRHKVTGIPGQQGQEYLLKWLVAYVNSSLARYYHFLTSNSWAVERGTIIHEEYKRMPFLLPDEDDPRLRKLLGYFDQLVALSRQTDELLSRDHTSDIQRIKDNIDDLVFDIYNIFPMARQLVRDMIEYEIKFFQWAKRKTRTLNDSYARSVRRPEPQLLKEYAMAFIEIVTTFLRFQDQTLNATVYQDGIPLNVLEFELVHLADAREVQFEGESKELRDLLYKLDRHLLENYASGLYTRRHVRIFDGSHFYLVRPSERRLWTRSQAYADADGFIVEMLAKSKAEAGVSY